MKKTLFLTYSLLKKTVCDRGRLLDVGSWKLEGNLMVVKGVSPKNNKADGKCRGRYGAI